MENKRVFEKRKFYNSDDSGKMFLTVILFQILVSLVLSLVANRIASVQGVDISVITSSPWFVIVQSLILILMYGLIFFLFNSLQGVSYSAAKIKFKVKWHYYFVAIFVGAIALFGLQYFVGIADEVLDKLGYPLDNSSLVSSTSFGSFVLSVFSLAVIPAIGEELIFRGVVFNGLRKHYSLTSSILISSLLFALMHLSLQQFVYPFLLGMIMAWIVARTGSIVCSMVVHFVNNFFVILQSYLYKIYGFSLALPSTWWYYLVAIGLLLTVGGIILLLDKYYFKKQSNNDVERDENEKPSKFVIIAIVIGVALLITFTILNIVSAKIE